MRPWLLIPLLAGCTAHPLPSAQFEATEQALSRALQMRADAPDAEAAETRYAQARRLQSEAATALAEGDRKQARELAERAELQARIAEAQWQDAKAEAQIALLERRIRRLQTRLEAGQ